MRNYRPHEYSYRTWIEISNSAISHNYRAFRSRLSRGAKIMGVVKSNAYGHELIGFSRQLVRLGIDWLGVDSISEGYTLRQSGITTPILILGYTLPQNLELAAKRGLSITVSQIENIRALVRLHTRAKIHLKIDSGMHRQGFFIDDLPAVLRLLKKNRRIEVEGVFTHFAESGNPEQLRDTEKQIKYFIKVLEMVRGEYPGTIAHASNTGGTINYAPGGVFDMVRIGSGLYGLWPSPETQAALAKRLRLAPALSWKSLIGEIKTVPKGERVGYGFTKKLQRETQVAIIPIGYWHGYDRGFSNRADVLVGGRRAPLLGRVSMDMITIDVTGIPLARVGSEVVLLGSQGRETISADDLGALIGTINYEIVTRINPLIKRDFVT